MATKANPSVFEIFGLGNYKIELIDSKNPWQCRGFLFDAVPAIALVSQIVGATAVMEDTAVQN